MSWFRAEWDRKDGKGTRTGYLRLKAVTMVERSERSMGDGAVTVPRAIVSLQNGQSVEVSGTEAERLFARLDRIARPPFLEEQDLEALRLNGFGDMAAA